MVKWWDQLSLDQMDAAQWEALCDRCGKCCLVKLEDEEDGAFYYTDFACTLLCSKTSQCRDYSNRFERVSSCVSIKKDNIDTVVAWLPKSCAYRRLHEGRKLASWHPLNAGNSDQMHSEGISCSGRIRSEDLALDDEALFEGLAAWPNHDTIE